VSEVGNTRARLRRAAFNSFKRHGYGPSSLRSVAADAGLTTGAVYSQFRDKAALLAEAVEALPRLPAPSARPSTGRAEAAVVLALATEAARIPALRKTLSQLLAREEAKLVPDGDLGDRGRVLLAAAVGELVLRVADMALPEGWADHIR
jgi:AcrR family transcriptional regulator